MTIDQLIVTGGQGGLQGGGVLNNDGDLTVDHSTITGNTAGLDNGGEGGGIYNSLGTLSIVDSTISANSVLNSTGGFPGDGGGIYNGGGTVSIDDSTISGNSADASGAGPGGDGAGYLGIQGTLLIDNSTISGNSADTAGGPGGSGGGISSFDETSTVDDSTLAGNTVGPGGLGGASLLALDGGSTTLAGDIFGNPGGSPAGGECLDGSGATIIDAAYNIDDDGTCGFSARGSVGDSSTIDSYLGPLQNNGGPTDTIALLPGNTETPNPAQAVIPASFISSGQTVAACSQSDQRGVTRDAPCDMGAYALTSASTSLYALADGTAPEPVHHRERYA